MRIDTAASIVAVLEDVIVISGISITLAITVRRLRMKWPLSIIGSGVILPSSFATATKLPPNVTLPITRAIAPVNLAIPEIAAVLPMSTTKAMIAEAAPPNPFNNATNWGICAILTYTASKQPGTAPKTIEIQRTFREIISLSIIVVIIAINMQAAPSRFPVRAVLGEFISLIPEIIPRTQTKLISL